MTNPYKPELETIICREGGTVEADFGDGFFFYCPIALKDGVEDVRCPYKSQPIADPVLGKIRYQCLNRDRQEVLVDVYKSQYELFDHLPSDIYARDDNGRQ